MRVSSKEQVSNLSLATQEAECRRFCASRGYEVAAVFTDAGESAKTVTAAPSSCEW
jgi:DNA invertase Pin-like site-specific DNA recombinase